MFYLCITFAIIIPYLICSINPAIIAAKLKHGKDIREMGSGNPGLTNALRTMGKRAAVVVLLFDVLKGVISVLAVWFFCSFAFPGMDSSAIPYRFQHEVQLFLWLAMLASVMGHCFPLYYKFKGGKAVLVTVAALFVVDWLSALILLSLFILIVAATRYVSLGSVIAAGLFPLCVLLLGTFVWDYSPRIIQTGAFFSGLIAGVLISKHRGNIQRLIAGTEKRLGKKEQE